MAALQVELFGTFSARRDGEPLVGLDGGKARELLGYLLLFRHKDHGRERLATLLWGDAATDQARKYLRQVLWQLQGALQFPAREADRQVLLVDGAHVRLNPAAALTVDVTTLERAFSAARDVPGPRLDGATVAALTTAVELYQGDLLEDWYCDWCSQERERLRGMYLSLLDKLIEHHVAECRYEVGIAYGLRALDCERARERTHRQLMRLYYLADDRTAALRQYRRCAAALAEDLGVSPARVTIDLYEQLRDDQLATDLVAPAARGRRTGPSVPPTPPHAIDPWGALQGLRAELVALERQVHRRVEQIEQILQQRPDTDLGIPSKIPQAVIPAPAQRQAGA